MGLLTTPSLGDSISVSLRKLLQGGRRGSQGKSGYTSLHQGKQAVWKAKIRYTVKEFSVLWEGSATGLAESVPFTISSAVRGQPCFPAHLALASPPLLSHHRGGDGILWVAVWGALIHIWTPEITDVCDVSRLWIWQEIFTFHKVKNTCPPKAWRNALGMVIGKEFKTRQAIMKPISRSLTHTL